MRGQFSLIISQTKHKGKDKADRAPVCLGFGRVTLNSTLFLIIDPKVMHPNSTGEYSWPTAEPRGKTWT